MFVFLFLQEDLRKAILASIEDFDPDNPWIVAASGRHTNVAALVDWPSDDSSDDESVPSKHKSKSTGQLVVFVTCLLTFNSTSCGLYC